MGPILFLHRDYLLAPSLLYANIHVPRSHHLPDESTYHSEMCVLQVGLSHLQGTSRALILAPITADKLCLIIGWEIIMNFKGDFRTEEIVEGFVIFSRKRL